MLSSRKEGFKISQYLIFYRQNYLSVFIWKKTEKKEKQEIVWHLELLLELQTFWTYEFIISFKIISFPGLKQIQTYF